MKVAAALAACREPVLASEIISRRVGELLQTSNAHNWVHFRFDDGDGFFNPASRILCHQAAPSPAATQPARATVPHNAAEAATGRGFFTPPPSHVSPPSNGGFSR
jgi:hypothetical protein